VHLLFFIFFIMAEEKKAEPKVQEVEAKVKTENKPASSSTSTTANSSADSMAMASLVVGVLSICGSFCAGLCCLPIALVGIVLGILGMKSEKNKTMAMVGIGLSVAGIVIAIIMTVVGSLVNYNDYSDWNY